MCVPRQQHTLGPEGGGGRDGRGRELSGWRQHQPALSMAEALRGACRGGGVQAHWLATLELSARSGVEVVMLARRLMAQVDGAALQSTLLYEGAARAVCRRPRPTEGNPAPGPERERSPLHAAVPVYKVAVRLLNQAIEAVDSLLDAVGEDAFPAALGPCTCAPSASADSAAAAERDGGGGRLDWAAHQTLRCSCACWRTPPWSSRRPKCVR